MKVSSLTSRENFYLTFIYAFNGLQERLPLWHKLRGIANQTRGPWAMGGDFNCVLSPTERCGGNTCPAEIDDFLRCVEDCEMMDIQAIGAFYTWNNKQRPEDRTYSRLDRFMVNKAWTDLFPNLYAHFLPEGLYDHTPCVVGSHVQNKKPRCFKYFNMWSKADQFITLVQDIWRMRIDGTPMFQVVKKLKALKPKLKMLNKARFSDIENKTNLMQIRVANIQEELGVNPTDSTKVAEEIMLSHELRELVPETVS
ncbi:uncharacterized protein LOC141613217 [Silene latifolia]|uniref:uncharacterized protein LOC141613217 n=1 Tax=Silene latifolia TaxID=37657 RepID=UPI003D787954